jgi:short-subunit dehydrogenase
VQLKDRVIIVTGASAGIGRVTAVALAQAGAHLLLTARREERLHSLIAELEAFPGRCLALAGDIRQESFAYEMIAHTVNEFGRVDVLLNNAGLGHRSLISEMPADDMRTIFDTNVLGLLYATQAAIWQMKKQEGGQIINVSSIVGQRPLPTSGVYCASKTAVNFVSRSLRMECRPHNITITLVYPGRTLTEFGQARLGAKGLNPSKLGQVSAARVAKAIVKAIRYGRTEVYVTWFDWLFTHTNRLFPRTTDWLTSFATRRIN